MTPQPDTAASVAANASPGLVYTVVAGILDIPIEKWVTILTLLLVALQIIFMVIDRFKKHRRRGQE
ncbi:hypothetical protein [Rugamonas sp.]|uniref:hypothetical protein n=1 Tax=Rugamonas sp. TaxID=1926287 RepID=UPI0025E43B08|nr:hypothetical protein [Rugamonas sp.]